MEARGSRTSGPGKSPKCWCFARAGDFQSVESSNRIEGVTRSANRLRLVVLRKARPRTARKKNWRATGEPSTGYSRAGIRDDDRAGVIRKLHLYAQGGSTLSGGGTRGVEEAQQ